MARLYLCGYQNTLYIWDEKWRTDNGIYVKWDGVISYTLSHLENDCDAIAYSRRKASVVGAIRLFFLTCSKRNPEFTHNGCVLLHLYLGAIGLRRGCFRGEKYRVNVSRCGGGECRRWQLNCHFFIPSRHVFKFS